MIIYGSRMYGKKNEKVGWGICEHCGAYGANTSYNARKWGHIYFIPLIPCGPKLRVIQECKNCDTGVHLPENKAPEVADSLREDTEKALKALLAGQEIYEDQGQKVSASALLMGSVDLLLSLEEDKHLQLMTSTLENQQLMKSFHLVRGAVLSYRGQLDEAGDHLRQAAELDPSDAMALMALGEWSLKKGDLPQAQTLYEKALTLSEDRLSVLSELLGIYEAQQDYVNLADTYEELFKLVPDAGKDKKIKKAYKKACKKAGKAPITF